MEGVGVATHDLLPRDALFVGLVDDLVLNVRDVLHEPNLVAPVPQIPDYHVPEQRRARVTDVDVVVDRRTTDVQADPAVLSNLHHSSAQSILDLNAHTPSLASRARFIRACASRAPSTVKRYAISGPL